MEGWRTKEERLEHFPENVERLIELLGEPEEDELYYTGK